jgi:hypothetical protein
MELSQEKATEISSTIPGATPQKLEAIFRVATEGGQLIFIEGNGCKISEGKSSYPDYLQLEISDAQVAMRLAQQLINACAESLACGGVLKSKVTLVLGGEATLSE